MLILAFPDALPQAQDLARALQLPCVAIEVHAFPDQESLLRLPEAIPERVILFRGLDRPNQKLIELLLAAETARHLGAREIILIAPYLCYMRQDKEFMPGQAVSQAIIGRFLAKLCDTLITVDPHLHRVTDLRTAVPTQRAISLGAAPLIGRFIAGQCDQPLLVGPDAESEQWVRQAADAIGADHIVASKVREGDTRVHIELPDFDYQGRNVVLVDDMVSTGHTLMSAASLLHERGAARVDAACTHALFGTATQRALEQAGIARIWSTDSIPHPSNRIALAEILAQTVRSCEAGMDSAC
ncbi:MAG: ribose-phosphate diphosphokinase [Gammaproteobacteria bacterium]|nr:ribose-phosphate diphosphokinase [Gammaproteobacteria bacterium]